MAIFTITVDESNNLPPNEIGNNSFTISYEDDLFQFTDTDFTTSTTPQYQDPEGDNPFKLKILSLPAEGNLYHNNTLVTINQEILFTSINNSLEYRIDPLITTTVATRFNFNISDVGSETYYQGSLLNRGIYYINVRAQRNFPPNQIGDNSISINDDIIYSFTRNDFTTNTTPVYQDPENDSADRLKITTLPTDGFIQLNGNNVSLNQIISFTEIDNGNLTYTPNNLISPYAIDFEFQISDSGSGLFTS